MPFLFITDLNLLWSIYLAAAAALTLPVCHSTALTAEAPSQLLHWSLLSGVSQREALAQRSQLLVVHERERHRRVAYQNVGIDYG